jgi:hypothetical protein
MEAVLQAAGQLRILGLFIRQSLSAFRAFGKEFHGPLGQNRTWCKRLSDRAPVRAELE